jgi:hypothetical protein
MRRLQFFMVAAAASALAACQSPIAPRSLDAPGAAVVGGSTVGGPTAAANGGGHYLLQNAFDTQFAFSATENDGGVHGQLHVQLTAGGAAIGFRGRVTCVSVDPINRRAWIGGVITENLSEDPAFQTARHQPGHDIWFRVLDSGEGADAPPDRTSFTGFEGDLMIPTSAEYCRQQPWADGNARTWPVTEGNIQVRP